MRAEATATKSGQLAAGLPETIDRPADLVEAREAARLEGVSVSTIYRWVLTGKVPGWRLGARYRVSRKLVLEMFGRVPARLAPRQF